MTKVLHPQKNPKSKTTTQKYHHKFDYTKTNSYFKRGQRLEQFRHISSKIGSLTIVLVFFGLLQDKDPKSIILELYVNSHK